VPEIFQQLADAAKLHPNVRPQCLALGSERGRRSICLDQDSMMTRFVPGQPQEGSTPVDVTTLADFCREHDIDQVNFLKIDTAGHERDVILGAGEFLNRVDFLQCVVSANTYNRFHASFGDIWRHMSEMNFYLYGIYRQTMEWTGGGYPIMRRFDSVFINARLVGPLKNVLDR
jgi:FkbM family methyltransferase